MQPEEPGIQQVFCPGLFHAQGVSALGYECATFTGNVKEKVAQ